MKVANGGLAHFEVLEFQGLAESVEQALAGAEGHRGDDDGELVDQSGRQGLADEGVGRAAKGQVNSQGGCYVRSAIAPGATARVCDPFG
jgi:hypothetical protein